MKFLTAITLLGTLSLLASCGQADVEETEQTSTPKMPPLTYTWSHEDCPFTADFPGKPEEEVIRNENGTIDVDATYYDENIFYSFQCDVNILSVFPERNLYSQSETLLMYTEALTDRPEINNQLIQTIDEKQSKFIQNARIKFKFNFLIPTNHIIQSNGIALSSENTLAKAFYSHVSSSPQEDKGNLFLQSIRIK